MLMQMLLNVPPGVPESVACQNPPASSDGQHGEPGGSQDCWWALVPRATARKTPAHVLAWFEGMPPDLYLVRKVMGCFEWFPAWQTNTRKIQAATGSQVSL